METAFEEGEGAGMERSEHPGKVSGKMKMVNEIF